MPFINSKVNVPLTEEVKEALKTKLGQAISLIPGKSENWLMVALRITVLSILKGRTIRRWLLSK